ncbi:hypothetical protein Q5P01_002797 [Channa striata]|uniref:Uncharacterized protein n=1 Tax=Channa striata TaxID=64152 RepID=A0AA88NS92_CHASR|nr:hypothetical protein Q5P01_002797 [Channa striata]
MRLMMKVYLLMWAVGAGVGSLSGDGDSEESSGSGSDDSPQSDKDNASSLSSSGNEDRKAVVCHLKKKSHSRRERGEEGIMMMMVKVCLLLWPVAATQCFSTTYGTTTELDYFEYGNDTDYFDLHIPEHFSHSPPWSVNDDDSSASSSSASADKTTLSPLYVVYLLRVVWLW